MNKLFIISLVLIGALVAAIPITIGIVRLWVYDDTDWFRSSSTDLKVINGTGYRCYEDHEIGYSYFYEHDKCFIDVSRFGVEPSIQETTRANFEIYWSGLSALLWNIELTLFMIIAPFLVGTYFLGKRLEKTLHPRV